MRAEDGSRAKGTYDVGVEERALDAEEGAAFGCPLCVRFGRFALKGEELVAPEPVRELAGLEKREEEVRKGKRVETEKRSKIGSQDRVV